jgi:hemerythrin
MHSWNPNLETGNEEIDHHHQELFHLTALLDQALQEQSLEKIDTIITFLEHYVVEHFEEEESLMKAHSYAFYVHHKSEHEIFKVRVSELRHIYNDGISRTHMIFTIRKLLDKLAYHIRTVDIGIAGIVNSK